jgi:hypothetical protein
MTLTENQAAIIIQNKFMDWYYKPECKDGTMGILMRSLCGPTTLSDSEILARVQNQIDISNQIFDVLESDDEIGIPLELSRILEESCGGGSNKELMEKVEKIREQFLE